MVRMAIIGDVHRHYSDFDTSYFNASDYDLLLFVGDLSNWWPREAVQIAGMLSALTIPSLFIPGNHDTINVFQLFAEIKHLGKAINLVSLGQDRRFAQLREQIYPVRVCGYSVHPIQKDGQQFDVIAARPFSMGGRNLGSHRYLRHTHNVDSLDDSARLLKKCVDESPSEQVIFLAHNGPTGLGARRSDIWGRDFTKSGGDFGDVDLRVAIDYAIKQGKHIIAVIAGHMHRRTIEDENRRWHVINDDIHYINSAYVPRIFRSKDATVHHHICLELEGTDVTVADVFIDRASWESPTAFDYNM
jgi:uncharacterized protein (TIGR04168 family)